MLRPGDLALDHAGRPSDYRAWARQAHAAGYRLDMRYVCRPETRPINRDKIARPDEVAAARDEGLAVGLVWQDGKEHPDTLRGEVGGRSDGIEAARQATELGYPKSCVIFIAVDFHPRPEHLAAIEAYFTAFDDVCPWPVGVYGHGTIIDRLLARGLAVQGWHVSTWGTTNRAHLRQRGPYAWVGGVKCDPNDVLADGLAVWNPGEPMDIVTRSEWGARAPRRRFTMPTPTPRLWLHHAAAEYEGAAGVRDCQNFHMDGRRWDDIAYSFLVDDDGTVYEGRGAGVVGAHTEGDNSSSHGICAMGNYQNREPSDRLMGRIAELVAHGARLGWWPNAITGGHRQAPGASTACPGERLFRRIPDINRLAAGQPAAPPPPPPPWDTPTIDIEEDALRTKLIGPVTLDPNGNGWTRWDPGLGRAPIPLSAQPHGPYPPADGYWYANNQPMTAMQTRGNEVIVAVSGGKPGGTLGVFVTVA